MHLLTPKEGRLSLLQAALFLQLGSASCRLSKQKYSCHSRVQIHPPLPCLLTSIFQITSFFPSVTLPLVETTIACLEDALEDVELLLHVNHIHPRPSPLGP